MEEFIQNIFSGEIHDQCQMILDATVDLEAAFHARRPYAVWRHLQTILVGSANLSKIFWGSQWGRPNEITAREVRRAPLREKFGVADDSPLKDTALRNDFEHFDDRLEKWRVEHPTGGFVGRIIGPPSAIVIEGEPENRRFQQFDPEAGAVAFWAHSVPLQPLIDEVQRIYRIP